MSSRRDGARLEPVWMLTTSDRRLLGRCLETTIDAGRGKELTSPATIRSSGWTAGIEVRYCSWVPPGKKWATLYGIWWSFAAFRPSWVDGTARDPNPQR